tara:strand:- start:571 stop:909 length:339 start_codon:yes stop_codon:yes gene_type:complete
MLGAVFAAIFAHLFVFDIKQGSAIAKELKVATFMGAKHPVNRGVVPHLAKNLAKETGGSLTLKLYPGGQLGKGPKAQYKRVIEKRGRNNLWRPRLHTKTFSTFNDCRPTGCR